MPFINCFLIVCSDIDSDVKSVKDFDADLLYKACTAYLRIIDETKAEPFADTLPRGMSARVNTCSNMAGVIKVNISILPSCRHAKQS